MAYSEYDLLALSGIQHFAFCRRQWALIHIEKQWRENLLTMQGKQLHKRVDNPSFFESRYDLLVSRALPLCSYELGLIGVADVVEFTAVDEGYGLSIKGHDGWWFPVPIEYKRGKPKSDEIDEVQLCAQGICLEEMLGIEIPYGYVYYGETRRRTKVVFSPALRSRVSCLSKSMHELFDVQITPEPIYSKKCESCSLMDVCMPRITGKRSVEEYIEGFLEGDA